MDLEGPEPWHLIPRHFVGPSCGSRRRLEWSHREMRPGRPKIGERRIIYCRACTAQERAELIEDESEWFLKRKRHSMKRIGWKCLRCGLFTVIMEIRDP